MAEELVDIPVRIHPDRVDELYEAAAKLAAPKEEPAPVPPGPWSKELAEAAVANLRDFERQLLWRVADARGQRIPVSELARDFGLPAETAPDADFPDLAAFCSESGKQRPPMPVLAGGSGADGWYCMDATASRHFRGALRAARVQQPGAPPPQPAQGQAAQQS